ncbi:MAG: [protein-PII] uridylyltransferase [Verrucomicrobiota bacterium]
MSTTRHLDRVLRHAERRLVAQAHHKPTDLLDLYRDFLKKELYMLELKHKGGEGGRQNCQKRAGLMTVLLQHVWKTALDSSLAAQGEKKAPPVCLVALGGFGRAELNPFSDIDILFLYRRQGRKMPPIVGDIVEQVSYMLWDVGGLKSNPITHSIEEQTDLCNEDLETKTALLERRLLAGDRDVLDEFGLRFERACLKGKEQAFLDWRLEDQRARHAKHENTPFLQEPQVKSSCGGLRDFQNLIWMAIVSRNIRSLTGLQHEGLITTTERKQLDAAYDFLLRVRTDMHLLQGRPGDLLTLRLQGKVANRLKYHHHTQLRRIEAMMRDYYQHANHIYLLTNSLSQRLAGREEQAPRKFWNLLPAATPKKEKIDGFVLENNVLEAEAPSVFTEDPFRLVRVFLLAQSRGAEIGPDLGFAIRRRLQHINRPFIYHKKTREILLEILSRKGQVGPVLRRMHELGVLGRLFPEFRPLTCLVQHEFYHLYTADEHTLVCVEKLDEIHEAKEGVFAKYAPLMQKMDRVYVLYLAMLLHDTGKSANAKLHAEASAQNAVRVARRLRLPVADLRLLVFLVDHHATLSETSRRINPDDEQAVLNFARIVRTPERLDRLMVLTFADFQGTSAARTHTDWKDMLLWQLYQRAQPVLAGGKEFKQQAKRSLIELQKSLTEKLSKELDSGEVAAHFQNLPPRYFLTFSEELIARHLRAVHQFLINQFMFEDATLKPVVVWHDRPDAAHSVCIVVSWNRDRNLAKIAAALAGSGLSVLSAEVFTRDDDIIIDTFRLCDERQRAVTDQRDKDKVEAALVEALARTQIEPADLPDSTPVNPFALDASELRTRVTFDQRSSREFTLMDVHSPDRQGLLARITRILAELDVEVIAARITTEKGAVLDTFYLADDDGRKLTEDKLLRKITRRIESALAK